MTGRMLLGAGALEAEEDERANLVTANNYADGVAATLALDGRRVRLLVERRQGKLYWEVRAL
jgi:hypothetical protein